MTHASAIALTSSHITVSSFIIIMVVFFFFKEIFVPCLKNSAKFDSL